MAWLNRLYRSRTGVTALLYSLLAAAGCADPPPALTPLATPPPVLSESGDVAIDVSSSVGSSNHPEPGRQASPCKDAAIGVPPTGPQRELPLGKLLTGARFTSGLSGNRSMTRDQARAMLDTAVPLDPCDPTIPTWQFSPDQDGRLDIAKLGTFQARLFLGGRGILIWPDGSSVMFDYGDTMSWIQGAGRSSLHREWQKDSECRQFSDRPHFVSFRPKGISDTGPIVDTISRHCARMGPDRAMNIGNWCCP